MEKATPEFLKNLNEEISNDALDKLQSYVAIYKELKTSIETLEEKLAGQKKLFNEYSGVMIPELLANFGLSEIKLATGEKVIVKDDISVTIKDAEQFFTFLESRKEDDIVKLHFDFGKMESSKVEDLFTFLMTNEYDFDSKKDVHTQTKKKYFKELLGIDKPDIEDGLKSGKYVRKELIETFAKIFTFHKTILK